MPVAKPAAGEDVRILWRYVDALVRSVNAMLNMQASMEGVLKGKGVLKQFGSTTEIKIDTGGVGLQAGPHELIHTPFTLAAVPGTNNLAADTGIPGVMGQITVFMNGVLYGGPWQVPASGAAIFPRPAGRGMVSAWYTGDAWHSQAWAYINQ